ncbi:hypothetical protein Vi05172_g8673 [Venturia inaequalis]|nr:hypothetical protein Vi05172_g8673 [Venturia inaequalis]
MDVQAKYRESIIARIFGSLESIDFQLVRRNYWARI